MASQINHYSDRPGRIQRLLEEMVRRFQGPDRFCEAWFEAYQHAVSAGKLHLAARHLNAVLNLSAAANRENDSPYAYLSTEDLQRATADELVSLVKSRPELAVEAARSLGWTVLIPESSSAE